MSSLIAKAKRVAFQGELGAFGNQAAREALPHCEAIPKQSFEDAVDAVRSGDTERDRHAIVAAVFIKRIQYLAEKLDIAIGMAGEVFRMPPQMKDSTFCRGAFHGSRNSPETDAFERTQSGRKRP